MKESTLDNGLHKFRFEPISKLDGLRVGTRLETTDGLLYEVKGAEEAKHDETSIPVYQLARIEGADKRGWGGQEIGDITNTINWPVETLFRILVP